MPDNQGWLTAGDDMATIEAVWSDAALVDAVVLQMYLDAGRDACQAYAPDADPAADIPAGWKIAQVMQARNIYNAGITPTSGDGDFSAGGYGISTYPLDWHVKQLLRPQRGAGAIF